MGLAQYLRPERIATGVASCTKAAVLRTLAGLVARDHDTLSEAAVLEVLLAREQLGSTGAGSGVAIPHGRIGGLEGIVASMVTAPEGIEFDAVDGRPVRILVAIVAPSEQPSQYLKVLADVSRLLRREAVRESLLEAESPDAAYAIIAG